MTTANSSANPLLDLLRYGQSVWMDNLRRGWIASGELAKMVREDGIRGVTTNPTIFEKAISGSTDYDDQIHELVKRGLGTSQVYEELMVTDIRMAADVMRSVYDSTDGLDGFVSLELPPSLAYDTDATVREAVRFRELVDRENMFIKVPGTPEGVPAIEELIYRGININVTLLFSIESYEQVAWAYVRGLRRRMEEGKPIDRIASVASFFVSRIDTAVDKRLEALAGNSEQKGVACSLVGKTAVANAKIAYQRFKSIFGGPEFKALELQGAREQRVLWASTSTKNPKYRDVYYVEELIGPRTVNTMPTQTVFAFKNHGRAYPTLEENLDAAQSAMDSLAKLGIDFSEVTNTLQIDGVKLFQKSVDELMDGLDVKRRTFAFLADQRQVIRIGDYQSRVDYALAALGEQAFSRRLWEKDASLWKQGPGSDQEIRERLGWLDVSVTMHERTDELASFAEEIRNAGFTSVVLMGMGGSSLSPEVSRLTFGVKPGYPNLIVLDSTVPGVVMDIDGRIDPAHTLFIVSTKSGSTVETLSAYRYFFDKVKAAKGDSAGENFVAITDPGTSLQDEARGAGFRRVFTNFADIGGRYSALSYFGLVPAALIGVDVKLLLDRAQGMVDSSSASISPEDSPGMVLGAVMGELAREGRDKLTLVLSDQIRSFGYWVEQLVAESTGKNGAGITPVEGEPLADPAHYGDDRLFVYMRLDGADNSELDSRIDALEHAGQPVVRVELNDVYDLGQEYYRWEIATAVACAILGVNAFDQPNVAESKDNTNRLIEHFISNGSLPAETPVLEESGISLFCDEEMKKVLDAIRNTGTHADSTLLAYLSAHLDQFQPGGYFVLMAFINPTPGVDGVLQCMRGHLRDAYSASTTLGYGPRFLHSTGQLHKGGPNTGIYIQFTSDDPVDVAIPGMPYSFSILKQAQAMGDAASLRAKGRPTIRIHLGSSAEDGLNRVLDIIHEAVAEQIQ